MSTALSLTAELPAQPRTEGQDYRLEHFHVGAVFQDMRFGRDSLKAGDRLPDTILQTVEGASVSLREMANGRPMVLVTGSVSCPLTASSTPDLNALEKRYGEDIQFVLLQVREAHPGAVLGQPDTPKRKLSHARIMKAAMGVHWPVLVDDIDGTLHRLLDTMPNSLHIISADGDILFRALFAGDSKVEEAIASAAHDKRPVIGESQSMLPILKSAGFMHDTLLGAGKGAYSDVLKAAPPMVLLALGTKLFPFLPKRLRGVGLMALLAVTAAVLVPLVA